MMKKKKFRSRQKPDGVVVKIGNRTLNVFKDYENATITVLEGEKEVWHGESILFHKWLSAEERKKKVQVEEDW